MTFSCREFLGSKSIRTEYLKTHFDTKTCRYLVESRNSWQLSPQRVDIDPDFTRLNDPRIQIR
jgi:hypothetical protein